MHESTRAAGPGHRQQPGKTARARIGPRLFLTACFERRGENQEPDGHIGRLVEAARDAVRRLAGAEATTPVHGTYEYVGVPYKHDLAEAPVDGVLDELRRGDRSRLVLWPGATRREAPWRLSVGLSFIEFPVVHPYLVVSLDAGAGDPERQADFPIDAVWSAFVSVVLESAPLLAFASYDISPAPFYEPASRGHLQDDRPMVPGYPWGLLVSEQHMEHLGGEDVWTAAPCLEARAVQAPGGARMGIARLSERPWDVDQDALRAWKAFLGPLLPRRPAGVYIGAPYISILPEDQPEMVM